MKTTLTKAGRVLSATALSGALLLAATPSATADQVRDGQWPNQFFDLQKVWSVSKGDGVIVAVIDNGVDPNQPDLSGQVLPGYDPDGLGRDHQPSGNSHGTQMASVIAGHGHGPGNADGIVGLAPDARILPLFKDTGSHDAVPQDIRWAVDHGAKVVNISVANAEHNPDLPSAVAYAASHDVLIVAGAGNNGTAVESPANEPGVVAVGASDKNGAIWNGSNYGSEIMLTAPGVGIVAAGIGSEYDIGTGTSDSTAYVSAAAALVRSKFPKLTAGQVANRLVKTALVPGQLQGAQLPDPHYGYGIVQPYAALTADVPTGPAQGPLAAPKDASAPSSAAGDSGGNPAPAVRTPSSSLPTGVLVVGGLLVLVVLVVVVVVVVVTRGRRKPPGGPGGPGAPGVPPYGSGPGWQQPGQPPYGGPGGPGYPPQPPYQGQPWQQGGNQQR